MNLPGWTCSLCRAFCGEAKERMTVCRACGAPRPEEIDGLDAVLQRDDLTDGERVVFADMRRAIEVHGARLTAGQMAWVATVRNRPERKKSVQEAAMGIEFGSAPFPTFRRPGITILTILTVIVLILAAWFLPHR